MNYKQIKKQNSSSALEAAMDRNAEHISAHVDWKSTPIIATDIARATCPLRQHTVARNSALARHRNSDMRELVSLIKRHAPKPIKSSSKNTSVAFDAAPSTNLSPGMNCLAAIDVLEANLANRQKDASAWQYWVSLRNFLTSQPKGATIADCQARTIRPLIQKLEANLMSA